jgi:two-component system sensor histidine kinase/response regulator
MMSHASLKGRRVLVVDDNATSRRIFTSLLERCGVSALAVESGVAALAALQSARDAGAPLDLVLLDFHMPETDGMAVAERISQDRQPGAFVTRHSLRESRSRLRILLAEDNDVNRAMIARMVEKRGHSVRTVEDGNGALAALAAEPFDLILMDVQMPELDGIATTIAIRQRERGTSNHIPILAITAHAMRGDRERFLQYGMDGYVSKPVRSRELFDAIGDLLSTDEAMPAEPADGVSADTAVFDESVALANTDDDRDMLADAVRICLDDLPKYVAEVRASLDRGDFGSLERAAHRMKSGLNLVGARGAAQAAERLEALASSPDIAACGLGVAVLEREVERLTLVLQSWKAAA